MREFNLAKLCDPHRHDVSNNWPVGLHTYLLGCAKMIKCNCCVNYFVASHNPPSSSIVVFRTAHMIKTSASICANEIKFISPFVVVVGITYKFSKNKIYCSLEGGQPKLIEIFSGLQSTK